MTPWLAVLDVADQEMLLQVIGKRSAADIGVELLLKTFELLYWDALLVLRNWNISNM